MKVQIKFPLPGRAEGHPDEAKRNRKEIREQLLLDSTGSGVERALLDAANAAKTPEQKTFVSRSYGRAGRLSVWIVDDTAARSGGGGLRAKKKALKEALARVTL